MTSILRSIVIGALFLIPFLTLYVANSSFFPFITGKGFLFRILVEIAFSAWVVLALMHAKYHPHFSWVLVLYGALTLWVLIADLFGANPGKAIWSNYERMDGWVTLVHAFLFFVVAGAFLSADRLWRAWWLAFIAASGIVCLYGLLQLVGGAQIHQGGVRVDASFGNAAYLAAYLLFAIAVTVWRAIESSGWLRYTLIALSVLQTLILFYTSTRGAILGFIGAAFVVALLWGFESRGKPRIIAAGLLVGLLVLIGGFWALRDSSFVQNNPTLTRLASISLESGAPRLAIWSMAVEGIKEQPILGWGQEGFNQVFNKYYQPSMYAQEPWFDRAHNVYLDWAIAGGIPALLLFLALLVTAVVLLYRRGAESSKAERVLLTGVLAAYAFQALFVFDNLFTYVPLAAVLAMAHIARAKKIPAIERIPLVGENTATTVAAPIAIAAFVIIVWFVNVPAMLAANRLVHALGEGDPDTALTLFKEAEGLSSLGSQEIAEQAVSYTLAIANAQSVPQDKKAAIATYALSLMKREIDAHPYDARLRLQYANAFRAAGDYTSAIREVEVARTISPRKQQILIQEGMLLWESKHKPEAAALFDAAYDLDPSFADIAAYKAAGALFTGKPEEANRVLLNAFGTTTVDHDALAFAYYETGRYNDLARVWEIRAAKGGAQDKYQLAFAYKLAGRIPEARAVIEATMKQYPESIAFGTQALTELSKP